MLRAMRNGLFSIGLVGALLGGACSSDSDDTAATGSLTPSPGSSAGGTGSQTPAAESNGSDPSAPAPSPNDESSSGSEAVDVSGPLDTSGNESESSNGPSSDADAGAAPPPADAGRPPAGEVCPPGPFPGDPLASAAAPQAVCTGLTFTEGAVWIAERNALFFSDILFNNPGAGSIVSFAPGGACQTFIENAGTNGLVIAPDGNLLGARHSDRTLTLFNLDTLEPTVFVADNAGVPLVSPNDIAVRSDGNIYFTDPDYGLGGAQAAQPPRAYRRDTSGALTVIDEQGNPNGITLSPDESLLYLSHLGGNPAVNDVLVFDVDASGAPVNPRPFITGGGSDGMGIDCAGNLYITQNGAVVVFAPDGTQVGSIAAPQAANIAFGGPERRTLFITAGPNLLATELAIPGLPY
jgi:gluconolactonase